MGERERYVDDGADGEVDGEVVRTLTFANCFAILVLPKSIVQPSHRIFCAVCYSRLCCAVYRLCQGRRNSTPILEKTKS